MKATQANLPCDLCRYFPHETQRLGFYRSPGIGLICETCNVHTHKACGILGGIPGIAHYPLPDHFRKNSRPGRNAK